MQNKTLITIFMIFYLKIEMRDAYMGVYDLISIFKGKQTKWFKFSVIASWLSLIMMFIIYIIVLRNKISNSSFDPQRFVWLSIFLLVVQAMMLIIRNFSKFKVIKGFLVSVLKLFVFVLFLFILYIMKFQELITPIQKYGESVMTIGSFISVSIIKITLG